MLLPFVKRSNGPQLVFVIAPSLHQLLELSYGTDRSLVLRPQEQLLAFCGRHNLLFCDLVEAFVRVPSPTELYIDDIVLVHFNDTGHKRVDMYLWPRLKANLRP